MNNDVMPSIVRMEPQVFMNLVKEVKETIATDIIMPEAKTVKNVFTAAEMWSIRKKMKTANSYLNR